MSSSLQSHFIGVDVGGTNLRAGLVDKAGTVLHFEKRPTPTDSLALFFDELISLIENIKKISPLPIAGIGVGWPGPVNSPQGLIYETPNIPLFKNFQFRDYLEKQLGLPVQIENDAKCAGLAEKKFGQAKNLKDFILLTFGTGIGGVIFSENQIIRGKSGLAGEIGHMTLYPFGENCSCGNKGCFERYCSSIALERMAERKLGLNLSSKEILELAQQHQNLSDLLDEYVKNISIGIGSLVNIFDPEAIVFSGGLFTSGGTIVLERLNALINEQGFQSLKNKLQLLPTQLEGKAGLIGAAALVF